MKNTFPYTILPIILISAPFLILSCGTPSESTGNDKGDELIRFPAYRVDEVGSASELTGKDRTLAKNIRRHQTEEVSPLESIERQSKVIRHIQSLSTSEIQNLVSGTGKTIASALNGKTLPRKYFGRWYRVRGTPISKPDDEPFEGHLNVDASVQQFTIKNPADYEEPGQNMYYVILTPDRLPPDKASEFILEMDGLLWTTWDYSAPSTSSPGDTPQTGIPVLFVKNLRIVEG